jgi:glycosyltransferase involved in cell wall biosynthesis
MPKITIITVNLNNTSGLQKTIESVISQSFQDYEFILVDGASTDGSVELIKENAQCITKWVSEPDTGIYQAMNKGIRMATGEYLLFLNSGDFLVDNHVLKNVFSQERSADILCGKCNISNEGVVVHTTNPPQNITFGTLYFNGLSHQSTFIKKELFQRIGYYRENFRINSDIEFWYRSIIWEGASTEKLDFIISDYNLDGLSSKENRTEEFLFEHKEILADPRLQKFIPDYDNWKKIKQEMKPLYWIKGKKVLYTFLLYIYKLALLYSKNKNKSKF